jgi:hypothetical protein
MLLRIDAEKEFLRAPHAKARTVERRFATAALLGRFRVRWEGHDDSKCCGTVVPYIASRGKKPTRLVPKTFEVCMCSADSIS